MGGGSWWNPNYVIDVQGTTNASGYFLYNGGSGYQTVKWSPWYGIPGGTRFGVSTGWAWAHPGWTGYWWRYISSC